MIWMLTSLALAGAPTGWVAPTAKGYTVERDTNAKDGSYSAVLRGAKGASKFGTMLQLLDPHAYRGERVRYSAWMRTEGVTDWAGAWMRVDAGEDVVAFDNMQERALRGDVEWTRISIVLDVHEDATGIVLGILLSGPGAVWLDDVQLDIVDTSVPVTDMKRKPQPSKPKNLDFEL
ncbi:MAG: hypothetical protein R3F61_10120 [Myxococcota bacterium]